MNITKPVKSKGQTTFTLSKKSGLDVSIVNSIRRTILNDIPILGFDTETSNDVYFHKNNTVLHNEYLEHRIGMIPLHINPAKYKPKSLLFVLNIRNDTGETKEVTTNDFEIYKLKNDAPEFEIENLDVETFKQIYESEPLDQEEKNRILDPFKFKDTLHYITITYLKDENITGDDKEEIVMFAIPSINTAKTNARFSGVSLATYSYTVDEKKADIERKARGKENEESFNNLDIQRFYQTDDLDRPNSFDFKIESQCYLNDMACFQKSVDILLESMKNLQKRINDEDEVLIKESEDIAEGLDIIIQNVDDTVGNVIHKVLVQDFIELTKKKRVEFCSYVRPHPLYEHITFKLVSKEDPKTILIDAIDNCVHILKDIRDSL
jgi:DNA-directed RNA polymerase subunit L